MNNTDEVDFSVGVTSDAAPKALRDKIRGMSLLAALYVLGVNLYTIAAIVAAVGAGGQAEAARFAVLTAAAAACALLFWLVVEAWTAQRRWACVILMLLASFEAIGKVLDLVSGARPPVWMVLIAVAAAGCGVEAVRAATKLQSGRPDERQTAGRGRGRAFAYVLTIPIFLALIALGEVFHGAPEPMPAASPAAPAATADPSAPAHDAVVPASELEGLYDPPKPATVSALQLRAHDLCNSRGTADHPLVFDELTEMAQGEIAIFDALARRGLTRSAADDKCYQDAQSQVREADQNEKLRGEAASDAAQPDANAAASAAPGVLATGPVP